MELHALTYRLLSSHIFYQCEFDIQHEWHKRIVTSQEVQPQLLKLFHWLFVIDFFVEILLNNSCSGIGKARIFQRGGGYIVSKWGYSFIWSFSSWNVMAFSPPVLGFLVKEGLQMGGSLAPQDPLHTPLSGCIVAVLWCKRLQSTNLELQTTYEKHRSQVRIHWGSRDHWPVSGLRITSRLNA